MYGAFIFDLDGTLVHSLPEHRQLLLGSTLKELGAPAETKAIDQFWFDYRRKEILESLFGVKKEDFWPVYRKYDTVELRQKYTYAYDDAKVLHEMKAKGIKLGIVTAASEHIAEFEMKLVGENLFDSVVLARDKIPSKPNPAGIEKCIEELNVPIDDVVYVGNGEEDVLAAKNADVLDIFIDRKEYPFKVSPTIQIESLYELREIMH